LNLIPSGILIFMEPLIKVTQTTSSTEPVRGPVLKDFPKGPSKAKIMMVLGAVLVVLAGVGTGWLASGRSGSSGPSETAAPGAKSSETEAGIVDEETFKDTAEGKLVEGGIEGEGTHHLDRDLGEDKYVYLTSSVIDLESFVGKKVQVWGQTISARNAGWLMDVGKVKVIE
jgi:hypothetical protein